MISRIIKEVLKSYGIDQGTVDKLKYLIDNIDIQEVEDQVCIDLNLRKVRIIIQKDKPEEGD